jgi:hypothetical protein
MLPRPGCNDFSRRERALLLVIRAREKIRRRMSGDRDPVRLQDGASSKFALPNRKEFAMKEFMYLFKDHNAKLNLSPEPMQSNMGEWRAWMQKLAELGKLKGGSPLENSGKTITGRAKVITDGPFPESKELVGGYLLVQVKDMDEAVLLAQGCPGLAIEQCSVEIRAVKSMEP